jgi:hypothetical protein
MSGGIGYQKSSPSTPTTVNWPSTNDTVLPMTSRCPPNRRRTPALVSTQTSGWATRSSSAVKVRPRAGRTRNTVKKSGDTLTPLITRAPSAHANV